MDFKDDNVTASIEEVALHSMLLTEAILELLTEKGILSGPEVLERVKNLRTETKLTFRRPDRPI